MRINSVLPRRATDCPPAAASQKSSLVLLTIGVGAAFGWLAQLNQEKLYALECAKVAPLQPVPEARLYCEQASRFELFAA